MEMLNKRFKICRLLNQLKRRRIVLGYISNRVFKMGNERKISAWTEEFRGKEWDCKIENMESGWDETLFTGRKENWWNDEQDLVG